MSDTPHPVSLDTTRLDSYRDLADEQGELLQAIIDAFVSATPDQLAAAEAATATGDVAALKRIAHDLKGSCGAIGAVGMMASASGLEQAVAAGDRAMIGSGVAALRPEFDRVTVLLAEYVRGLKSR